MMLAHSWLPRRMKKFSGYLILNAKSRQIVSSDWHQRHLKTKGIVLVTGAAIPACLDRRSHPRRGSWPVATHSIKVEGTRRLRTKTSLHLWWEFAILEEAEEIIILSMDISTDFDRGLKF